MGGNLALNTVMFQGKSVRNASLGRGHGFPGRTWISTVGSFDSIRLIVKISQWPAGNNYNIIFFLSPLGSWKYTVEDYKVNMKFGVCCVHSSPGQCRGLEIGGGLEIWSLS